LNTIRSLARRIAAIATDPHPPRNSKLLLDHLSETAAQARNRIHSYNHELDDSMLAHPDGHFTQILFHAEMLCARGKVFKVSPGSPSAFCSLFRSSIIIFDALRCRHWLIVKTRPE
jgi:hypothetical protein